MKTDRERSKERLLHILEAAEKIGTFTVGMTEPVFMKNEQTQGAVLFQFSIIGEAIAHVDTGILEKHSYPWHQARAFRNIIAHEYFGIRMEKVWSIVRYDLPELKRRVKEVLAKEF